MRINHWGNLGLKIPDVKKNPILVISPDGATVQTIASYYTKHEGVPEKNIIHVADTKQAIHKVLKEGKLYNLIFMDIALKSIPCDELYQMVVAQSNGPTVIINNPGHRLEMRLRDLEAPYFITRTILNDETLVGVFVGAFQHFGLQTALRQSEARFRKMADAQSDAIFFVTPQKLEKGKPNLSKSTITYANPAALKHFFGNKHLPSVAGKPLEKILAAGEINKIKKMINLCLQTGQPHGGMVEILHEKGGNHFSSWLKYQVLPSGEEVALIFEDITARLMAEEKIRHSEQRFKDIADSFSDWIWEIDTEMTVIYVSKGRSRSGLSVTAGTGFTSCFLPEDRIKVKEDFRALFTRREPFNDFEYWGLDQQGMRVCWSVSGVPMFGAEKQFIGYRGVAKDISSEKASQDQLYYMANNDMLTGLYNRGRFYDELARAVRDVRRHKTKGAVMLIDLDRFKYVNDTFGHDAGDNMLVHVAHVLRECIGAEHIISRLGGDEFAIIFNNIREEQVTDAAAELLERMGAAPFVHADHEISLTASVGIVMFPTQGVASGELLSKADIAMYRAKADGRNRWYIFDETHVRDHGMSKRLEVVDFIIKCLEEDRVRLYFQPIVPLQTKGKRQIKHYEVLCRMIDDKGEIVMPAHFIETAEDFGLIHRIDEFICRKALKFMQKEHASGRDLSLAINLSGITFDDEETMARIRALVQHARLPEGRVIFEITETAALKDIGRAQRAIRELKKIGCKLALDDFGVGYSSFNYVRHLDIDYVKIDGSFIRQIHQNVEDQVFVRALNDVAKGMNIQTIAEMVEDGDVENHIREIGIDYGQGYHFGRPAPELLDESV